VRLTQTEIDRVLIFNVAEMARRRRDRGLQLNYPEAVALITDEMMELARAGAAWEEVRRFGLGILTADDVLPGVPELARGLTCEPMFGDGPRIIVLAEPIPVTANSGGPGERILRDEPITLNAGRDTITVTVRNGSDHHVNISSHFHFYEVNPRMEFDRRRTYGRRLDIQAGRSIIWKPGETKDVSLVPYAGARTVDGFQRTLPPTDADEITMNGTA
jgi:urease subunit gamma/beta